MLLHIYFCKICLFFLLMPRRLGNPILTNTRLGNRQVYAVFLPMGRGHWVLLSILMRGIYHLVFPFSTVVWPKNMYWICMFRVIKNKYPEWKFYEKNIKFSEAFPAGKRPTKLKHFPVGSCSTRTTKWLNVSQNL